MWQNQMILFGLNSSLNPLIYHGLFLAFFLQEVPKSELEAV